jgi:hypothetical protein
MNEKQTDKTRASIYREDGTPRHAACYEQKRNPAYDRFTVVFTHANLMGYPAGVVIYRSMSDHPCAPQGCGQWGESPRHSFSPGGSRISFSTLPEDCRKLIVQDYRELWGA